MPGIPIKQLGGLEEQCKLGVSLKETHNGNAQPLLLLHMPMQLLTQGNNNSMTGTCLGIDHELSVDECTKKATINLCKLLSNKALIEEYTGVVMISAAC